MNKIQRYEIKIRFESLSPEFEFIETKDENGLCFGRFVKDVAELESELTAVQAENEKLRGVFREYWVASEIIYTNRQYEDFIQKGKEFDSWLKQKLEETVGS